MIISVVFSLTWPFIAKHLWDYDISWKEVGLNILIVLVVAAGIWQLGRYGRTQDTEIWNGQVTGKERVHGHYTRSYDCMCTTDSEGYETCQTCYEDRYTVTWYGYTTVGTVTFDHEDRGSRRVYSFPDPSSYKECEKGQPASLPHTYTNYIQAVPNGVFFKSPEHNTYPYTIPDQPKVHNFYRINRVLSVGGVHTDSNRINELLNDHLRTMGARKQVNITVVFTKVMDPNYRYALENEWEGVNKNDVVIVAGVKNKTMYWIDVITWAGNYGNEMLQVKLREDLVNTTVDADKFTETVVSRIEELYTRPSGAAFEYLKRYVQPKFWVQIVASVFCVLGSLGLSLIFRTTRI